MAKRPMYKSDKRKKEVKRQQKQEAKRQKRLADKGPQPAEGLVIDGEAAPQEGQSPDQPAEGSVDKPGQTDEGC